MQFNTNELQGLRERGLDVAGNSRYIPDDFVFEWPCGIKMCNVEQQCTLGAFSYVVSGFLCGVEIGRYCSFGENVQIGRQSHPVGWVSTSPFTYMNSHHVLCSEIGNAGHTGEMNHTKAPTSLSKTVIENDVWIGHGALVLPGVNIGTGAIVAAGAVVTKNVSPYSIVGGNPARHIRYRIPEELIEDLLNTKWWEYGPKDICIYDMSNISEFLKKFSVDRPNLKKHSSEFLKVGEIKSE